MRFESKGPSVVYLPRAGLKVRFDADGFYETIDDREISALKKSRHVKEAKKSRGVMRHKEEPSRATSPPVKPKDFAVTTSGDQDNVIDPENYSRSELNALAFREGVQSPENLPNKGAVADAINKQ